MNKNEVGSKSGNDFFELNLRGRSYKIFLIGEDELDSLLTSEKVVKLDNQLFRDHSLDVFRMNDKRVVAVRKNENEFPVYPSENILVNQILDSAQGDTKEILEGINIYGKGFAENAKKIADVFLRKLKIVDKNKSPINIIEDVDSVVSGNRTKKIFEENYLSLIALLGELANAEYGTSWSMIRSEKKDVWNPCLSFNGKNIFFADYILIDFDNRTVSNPIMLSYISLTDIIKFHRGKVDGNVSE